MKPEEWDVVQRMQAGEREAFGEVYEQYARRVYAFALRRLREIGIRLALGAQRADIRRLVLGEGVRLLVIGLVIGLAGVFATAQILRGFLFEVSPTDPSVSIGVSLLLIAAALTAAWWPARRAARVDPIVTLRAE